MNKKGIIKDPFDKLNEVSQPNTPIQKVVPINEFKQRKRDQEQSYTLYLNKELLKELKDMAYHNNTNVKELVQKSIEEFLKRRK